MPELNFQKEQQAYFNETYDVDAVAASLDKFLTERNPQYLLLGEVDHAHGMQNLKLLSEPKIQQVFQKHGFNDIALEARQELQASADAIAQGTLSPAKLGKEAASWYKAQGDKESHLAVASYVARGELVRDAHARGLNVHFSETQADPVTGLKTQDLLDKIFKKEVFPTLKPGSYYQGQAREKLASVFEQAAVPPSIEYMEKSSFEVADSVVRDRSRDRYSAMQANETVRELDTQNRRDRQAHDSVLADNIKASTDGRKTVVLYGSAHGAGERDLDEHLPGSVRLSLCQNRPEMIEVIQRVDIEGDQQPNAFLNLATGTITSAADAAKIGTTITPPVPSSVVQP